MARLYQMMLWGLDRRPKADPSSIDPSPIKQFAILIFSPSFPH
ncbi:hypothetical protein MC7420_2682 [Coleofasciculus chthonoplastes PCC 7420]|uniref:Uncharacterized protein n=1 Tax=Coleofasciculus chthonoplastes PCC 7420 TaxID=118168 RepID=B4VYC8_9CYAN|nr:hypothetical protein [Coleofasciculus chthonoplastes]EDX73064.1 hypothetical protein MC7420_2682 [Coleofasciculus chthonoplastes PCC 7420]